MLKGYTPRPRFKLECKSRHRFQNVRYPYWHVIYLSLVWVYEKSYLSRLWRKNWCWHFMLASPSGKSLDLWKVRSVGQIRCALWMCITQFCGDFWFSGWPSSARRWNLTWRSHEALWSQLLTGALNGATNQKIGIPVFNNRTIAQSHLQETRLKLMFVPRWASHTHWILKI